MKNKVSGSGDSIFKKKGFFIALYSCLGAVMVLALVISFTNLTSGPTGNETAERTETTDNAVNVNADNVENYLTQAENRAAQEEAWRKPTATPKPTPKPTPQPTPQPTPRPAQPSQAPTPAASPAAPNTAAPAGNAQPASSPAPTESANPPRAEETSAEASAEVAFTPFSEGDKMIWPVYGDIAMVFSMDKLIYDPTLDQYRTNDDLRIAAQEGTPVKAGADGKVLAIGNDHVYGNYVEVDHGNGWVATYGQLMDGLLVREGDTVKSGQVIGGVGKPSYFGSLNGSHINLRVRKDDEPIDPRTVLADGE